MKKYKFSVKLKNGLVGTEVVLGNSPEDAAKDLSMRNDIESYTYLGPA